MRHYQVKTDHHRSSIREIPINPRLNYHRCICAAHPNNNSQENYNITRRLLAAGAAGTLAMPTLTTSAAAAFSSSTSFIMPPPDTKVHEVKMVLRIAALRGSVPQSWSTDFSTAMEGFGFVAITQRPKLTDILSDLRGASKKKVPPTTADLVTLPDTWLQGAIQEALVQPIPLAKQHRWWSRLAEWPEWQHLVTRSPLTGATTTQRGGGELEVYGCPYRFGCLLLVSRIHNNHRNSSINLILDWNDLLQPALKKKIAFMDSSRELVGVALKTLGLSFNTSARDLSKCGLTEEDVIRRVDQLASQIRVFGSMDSTRAMTAGEVDVAVGWSDDMLPLAARSNDLQAAAPASGSALWADLWCVPSNASGGAVDGEPSPLIHAWMELGLMPSRAQPSRGLRGGGASPLMLPSLASPLMSVGFRKKEKERENMCNLLVLESPGEEVNGDYGLVGGGVMPTESVLKQSEFLLPLDDDTRELYWRCLHNII